MGLAGKTVVITGGAAGIGRALVEKALSLSARVVALDTNGDLLETQLKEARKFGYDYRTFTVDVGDEKALRDVRDRIKTEMNAIDVWVNNAGISGLGDFMDLELSKIEQVIRINLLGAIFGTRLALEVMEPKGRGSIVNIDSAAGHVAAPYLTAYCASKHGLVGFSRALREELKIKDSNVRIISVSPGFVDTAILEKGTQRGFPEWLQWTLATPTSVATHIFEAVERGIEEVQPTLNGKLLLKMNRLFPGATRRSSRVLLSKNVKDLLFLRKQPPK